MTKRILSAFVLTLFSIVIFAQTDVTSKYIKNANLSSTDGWTLTNMNAGPTAATNGTDYAIEFYAGWNALNVTTFGITQTITLPKGQYRLVNYSFFRQGQAYSSDASKSLATLKAGSATATIKTLGSISATGYANSLTDAAGVLASKEYRNYVDFTVATDNSAVEIGVTGKFDAGYSWSTVGPFELYDLSTVTTSSASINDTYLICNSSFEHQDIGGWTNSGTVSLGSLRTSPADNPKIGTYFAEKWAASGSIDFNQTVTNLPAGTYTIDVRARNEASATAYLYANDAKTQITQNSTKNYTVNVTLTEKGSIRLGVKCDSHPANTWFAIDHFTLMGQDCVNYLGDVNEDKRISIADEAQLVKSLNDNSVNALPFGADANQDGAVTVDDASALSDVLLSNRRSVFNNNNYNLTVYAEQKNSENQSGNVYQLNTAENIDMSKVKDVSKTLTTVKVDASALSNISSVSIYAKGKENIAGNLSYNTSDNTFTVSAGDASTYASGTTSDVVTVNNDNSATSFTAYLLPTGLGNGVTVTVRTSDGKFYSQDFSDIKARETNELTFNSTTPSGNWMATIPGNIHFNFLSIPGAHDAATKGCSENTTECQSMSIADLLKSGVHALDLRPYANNSTTADDMYIYHGTSKTGYLFKNALSEIVDYLKNHSSETVFVLIHEEDGKNFDAWKSAVLTCLQNVSSYVKVIDGNMLLDDCRGKMVIISRDNVGATTLCGKCGWGSSFNDKTVFKGSDSNGTTPWTLVYQDEYNESSNTNRVANVEKLLTSYIQANETNKNRIFFNSSNISWGYTFNGSRNIKTTAKIINQAIINSTTFQNSAGRWGIMSGDYMGDSAYYGDQLVKMIINQNYRYVYKGRTRVE